jgi:hypothetical protein
MMRSSILQKSRRIMLTAIRANREGKTSACSGKPPLFRVISAAIFIYVGLWQDGLNGLIVNPQWTILTVTSVLVLATEYFAKNKPQS